MTMNTPLPVAWVIAVLPDGLVRVICPHKARSTRHRHMVYVPPGPVHGHERHTPSCGPYIVQFRDEKARKSGESQRAALQGRHNNPGGSA